MPNDLESVRRALLVLAALVEHQLRRAIGAFFAGDPAAARLVIAADADVDELELRLDDACVAAARAPSLAAADLRFLLAAMKIATALERIGDEAAGMARTVLTPHPPAAPLLELARLVRGMLCDAVEALGRADVALARRVIGEEEAPEALAERIAARLVQAPLADPARMGEAASAGEVLRHLERIAAHAVGIAGMVVFAAGAAAEPQRDAA